MLKLKTFLSKYSSQISLEWSNIFHIYINYIVAYQYFIFKIDITILPPWFWEKKSQLNKITCNLLEFLVKLLQSIYKIKYSTNW